MQHTHYSPCPKTISTFCVGLASSFAITRTSIKGSVDLSFDPFCFSEMPSIFGSLSTAGIRDSDFSVKPIGDLRRNHGNTQSK